MIPLEIHRGSYASLAKDTDFTVKLIDLYPPNPDYPAGVDLNVGDGIVRARYRESLKSARLLAGSENAVYHDPLHPSRIVLPIIPPASR